MGRSQYRIPVPAGSVSVSDFISSRAMIRPDQTVIPSKVHSIFESYQDLLRQANYEEAVIRVFPIEMDKTLELVKVTGKPLLIPDTEKQENFLQNDSNLVNFAKEAVWEIKEAMSYYKANEIKSELIVPIFHFNQRRERILLGSIRVSSKSKSYGMIDCSELTAFANKISDALQKQNEPVSKNIMKVQDMSPKGLRLRIYNESILENLTTNHEYLFFVHFLKEPPFSVKGSLRWWSKSTEGCLEIGLEIVTIFGPENERVRFEKAVELLRDAFVNMQAEISGRSLDQLSPERSERLNPDLAQKARILHIDSDEESLQKVRSLFEKEGVSIESVNSPTLALEYCLLSPPSVIITETDFPDLDTMFFLKALRRISSASVFVIYSARGRFSQFRNSFSWVWAFLEKPTEEPLLVSCCMEASKYRAKNATFLRTHTTEEEIVSEIEWLLWKEYHRNTDQLSLGKTIFENITHSSSQGLGVGSMLIQLDLAECFIKRERDACLIPVDVMNSIMENKNVLRTWTDKMENVRSLFDLKLEREPIHTNEIRRIVNKTISELGELTKVKNAKVTFVDKDLDKELTSHVEFAKFSIKELLVNALKFSPVDSSIHLFFSATEDSLYLDVMNHIDVLPNGISGIPEEYKSRIFEPFFKLTHNYDERFHSVDFGLGIGLSVVQNLSEQVGCTVTVGEITDHTSENLKKKISARIQFPIYQPAAELETIVSKPTNLANALLRIYTGSAYSGKNQAE
ncbi:hypothetical protein CH373_17935 [Leptospira perolatii]|uniref:histidine kinase n=1 Tax=Leptospira perolatii TaxID=2023191 RepID=A0A2M9ZI68_9LEPT|nr:DUF1577 domain-containing protein [Leptospira perolatii]PJZ68128.1 hypothetical protein CH360_17880 [Leptospira perolatii]PJZ71749.1 hypothetical protein CH373_17935 [Leptospira perolatii]